MSKDLSVLGRELCQEFDDRQMELKKLNFQVQVDLRKQCGELNHQKKIDISERHAEKLRLQTEVKALLDGYTQERKKLWKILEKDRVVQTSELKLWLDEFRGHLKTWQKSVQYIYSKS
jgi:hypothetical protein